jgi:hypothetical protein
MRLDVKTKPFPVVVQLAPRRAIIFFLKEVGHLCQNNHQPLFDDAVGCELDRLDSF